MNKGLAQLSEGLLRLQRLNRILAWIAVVLAVVLLADFALWPAPVAPVPDAGGVSQDIAPIAGRMPFAQYASGLSRRLFHSKRRAATARQAHGESLTLAGEAAHLELQMVLMDDDPQALVADKRNGQSYRVRKGQMIGQIQVLEVVADGLILFYRGERLKLTL